MGISQRFHALHDLPSFPNPRPGKPLGHLYLETHCKNAPEPILIPAALLPEISFAISLYAYGVGSSSERDAWRDIQGAGFLDIYILHRSIYIEQ